MQLCKTPIRFEQRLVQLMRNSTQPWGPTNLPHWATGRESNGEAKHPSRVLYYLAVYEREGKLAQVTSVSSNPSQTPNPNPPPTQTRT